MTMTAEQVARLTRSQREDRVLDLVAQAHQLVIDVVRQQYNQGKGTAAVAVLYSGGNDSTVLAHMFRHRATHAVHANTGIGIEATRQFVRDTCAIWGLKLIEEHPPTSYRDLVIDQGFPGPAHHWKMYQRLKERCLEQARTKLNPYPKYNRLLYLAGRRNDESARRQNLQSVDRKGSMVFVSPMLSWTAMDLNTYRLMAGDVPVNPVTELIHMSGECLCGAFAHAGELDEIGEWFPEVRAEIEGLEAEVLATGKHPAWRCRWGWGADKDAIVKLKRKGASDAEITRLFARSEVGPLCSSCEARSV